MFELFKKAKEILSDRGELDLNYLHGRKLNQVPHLTRVPPRYTGFILRLGVFLHRIGKGFSLHTHLSHFKENEVLIYSSSENQFKATKSIAHLLRKKYNINVLELLSNKVKPVNGRTLTECFSPKIIIFCILLIVSRIGFLRFLIKNRLKYKTSWYLDYYLRVYLYLAYFFVNLSRSNTKIIITSNDHSVENRCLLFVARKLSIPIAYVQHAAVTEIFPPLEFDYAFLDGVYSFEVYRKIKRNLNSSGFQFTCESKMYLTGQLSEFYQRNQEVSHITNFDFGFALNAMDDPKIVMNFVRELAEKGLSVLIRLHPSHPSAVADEMKDLVLSQNRCALAPPKEPLIEFLERCVYVIAADTSLHLDAAIYGKTTFYKKLSSSAVDDYYGFVRNGVCQRVENYSDIEQAIANPLERAELTSAIRLYSETFGTEQQGDESDTVSKKIFSILISLKENLC